MIDLTKIRKEPRPTFFVMPYNIYFYFSILLDEAGIPYTSYDQYELRQILKKNGKRAKRLIEKDGIIYLKNDKTWNRFIEKDTRFEQESPCLIVSHMNIDDLFSATCQCFGKSIDPDYRKMVIEDLEISDQMAIEELKWLGEKEVNLCDSKAAYLFE